MAPKSKASTASSLTQRTLSFGSSKRGAAATASGKANVKAPLATGAAKPATTNIVLKSNAVRRVSQESASARSSTASDSDREDREFALAGRAAKRQKTADGAAKASGVGAGNRHRALSMSSDEDAPPATPRGDLDVLESGDALNRLYGYSKDKMGGLKPIHSENQTKVHHILRIFDTSFEYGPCIGVTRIERWERAHALGLNPPGEIRDILMTEQGFNEDEYKQCVFYDEV